MAAFASAIDTALSTVTVERNRAKDVPVDSTSYVVIMDGPQYIAQDEVGKKVYTTTPTVSIYSRSTTSSAAVTALNALYANMLTAALADYSLGGKAIDVREGDMQDVFIDPEASKPTVAASVTFEIDYQTKPLDPYTLGP